MSGTPITPVTQEITSVLRAVCQEPGAQAKCMLPILSVPQPGLLLCSHVDQLSPSSPSPVLTSEEAEATQVRGFPLELLSRAWVLSCYAPCLIFLCSNITT